MCRYRGFLVGALLLMAGISCSAKSADDSLYTLLRSIPTPQQLVYPFFPAAYRVAVQMSGPMADEMQATLTGLGAANAQFEEVFENRQSRLEVANPDYTYETRELVCGILNPIAMTDVVLASFIRYRNEAELKALIAETVKTQSVVHTAGHTRFQITFTPRGERFAYRYEDQGSHVAESWLRRLMVEVDSASKTVSAIVLSRHSRLVDATQTAPAAVVIDDYQYVIQYDTVMSAIVPVQLVMTRNNKPVLVMRAAYRHEKERLVFDHRSICMTAANGTTQCLELAYGTYRFSTQTPVAHGIIKNDAMAHQMKQAAKLLREVRDELTKGNINSALSKLNECVDRYGQTPQSLEARRLLQGLPGR